PRMFRVRQQFEAQRVGDIPATVEAELRRLNLGQAIKPDSNVAVTAGSRGIANIHIIIKGVVDHLKSIGARPFIVPAMGSHGGGTAEGQKAIVEGYGMTEAYLGCPIKATMETVVVCETPEGIPVHFDRHAYEADHVVVVGRVKPHTNFVGDIESGLMKMMLIGLGKHEGAKIYHRAITDYSFSQILRSVAGQVLSKCRIAAGLGIVENGYDETAKIQAVAPHEFEPRERELLVLAKKWMPKVPFDRADILIVDQIGKNISGAGLDSNVVGRKFLDHRAAEDEWPKIKKIWVRALTEETHGNAAGVGMAEFCSQKVVDQIDLKITKINCITGGHSTGAMLPVYYETEREVYDTALQSIGLTPPPRAKVQWIRDTLHVAEVECSAAYWEDAQQRSDLEILTDPRDVEFDMHGNLVDFDPALAAH
ncbi:MAG: lactate racemase domain-containing protein, partial [Pirellulales bacterium]